MWQRKKELKRIRKEMSEVPYECRRMYIKFISYKENAMNLKNEFDKFLEKNGRK
jgi:hypothetical protein